LAAPQREPTLAGGDGGRHQLQANLSDILIESKGYGAAGSKMTDVVGDANKIIEAKRPDTPFIRQYHADSTSPK